MYWNKASNLLFVESPAGVGWSYSNRTSDCKTGDESTANDMLVFLLRWFSKFPELKSRDLFLIELIMQIVEIFIIQVTLGGYFEIFITQVTLNPLTQWRML